MISNYKIFVYVIFFFNLSNIINISKCISKNVFIKEFLLIHGNLGIGKTTIINYIIKSLKNKTDYINSPTFNIKKRHKTLMMSILHYDLYRLKSIKEIYELELKKNSSVNIIIIEWGEITKHVLKLYYNEIFIFETCYNKIKRIYFIFNKLKKYLNY